MSKKARTDSASSLVLAQLVEDKDVSENAPKMKNDKCVSAKCDLQIPWNLVVTVVPDQFSTGIILILQHDLLHALKQKDKQENIILVNCTKGSE